MADTDAHEFVATLAAILASIVFFLVFDTALARIDARETRMQAANEYKAGNELLVAGKPREAVERLRTASTLDRNNTTYTIALAAATLAEGRPQTAQEVLRPALDRQSTDGAANLLMARILVREGRSGEAASYYHRAIYGSWADDADRSRIAARFELIDLLAKTGRKQELLSELLPLQDDSSMATSARKRIAQLLLEGGAETRAAAMFREILKENPNDPDVYVGLGNSALALGDFRTARSHFEAASRLSAGKGVIERRVAAIDTAIAMDPTQRGLGREEELRRSRTLLNRTIAFVRSCGRLPSERAVFVDSVALSLADSTQTATSATADANIALAQELWRLRPAGCGALPAASDDPLVLVQARLER
jgi:tetratricopeptide (TPR) repeat protein